MSGRYSLQDIAELSGAPKRTIYTWDQRGILSPTRDGRGRLVFSDRDLSIARQRVQALKVRLTPRASIDDIVRLLPTADRAIVECSAERLAQQVLR